MDTCIKSLTAVFEKTCATTQNNVKMFLVLDFEKNNVKNVRRPIVSHSQAI